MHTLKIIGAIAVMAWLFWLINDAQHALFSVFFLGYALVYIAVLAFPFAIGLIFIGLFIALLIAAIRYLIALTNKASTGVTE